MSRLIYGQLLLCLFGSAASLACSEAAPDSPNGTAGSSGGGSVLPTAGAPSTAGSPQTTGTAGVGGMFTAGTAGASSNTAGSPTGEAGSTSTAGAGGGGASAGGGSGTAGMGPTGTITVPRGKSAGCEKPPPGADSSSNFVKHDVAVTGVDPAFIAAHMPSPGNNGGYTFAMRNYYVKLPANYDPSKPYAVTFGGGGCGNTGGDSGKGGGQQASGIDAIKIGLSYVYSGGACFEDGFANTPEVPYFDAVMKDISANYCVNLEKVFVGGYSSGAWEAVTLGMARGGVIRGIATGAGGLRKDRPMPSGIPMAAILLTGQGDNTNPITGPTGSAMARDAILMTNKCVGTETTPFAGDKDCQQYMGCPAAFPVVWCTPGGGHTGGSNEHWAAVGAFWNALPPVP